MREWAFYYVKLNIYNEFVYVRIYNCVYTWYYKYIEKVIKKEETKMKNVMTRAWEIAKEGVAKFGGKVKEYFAQALVLAWAEIKRGVAKVLEIGYMEIAKQNGTLYFAVNNIEGLEVTYLTTEKNLYNGKMFTKKHKMDYKEATNNKTGAQVRLYNIAIHTGDIEIKLGNEVEVITNSYDRKKWGL